MVVKIKKIGGSLAVVIPKAMASELGLAPGMSMDISMNRDTITMRKQATRTRRRMSEIAKQIDPKSYERRRAEDLDAGQVGKEVW